MLGFWMRETSASCRKQTQPVALGLSTSQVHAVYCRCTLGLDLTESFRDSAEILTNLRMFTIWSYLLFHLHLFSFLLFCGTNRASVLSVFILRHWPHACSSCLSLPTAMTADAHHELSSWFCTIVKWLLCATSAHNCVSFGEGEFSYTAQFVC